VFRFRNVKLLRFSISSQ